MSTTRATSPGAGGITGAGLSAVTEVARKLLPADGVITDRARLRTYECDGLAHYRVTPALVVLPDGRAASWPRWSRRVPSTRCRTSQAARGQASPAVRCRMRTAY